MMKKEIRFAAAFDKRDENPHNNYGVHGVDLHFALIGSKGAISFTVFTNWNLPHVQAERNEQDAPIGADISYHSYTEKYDGQTPTDKCSLLDNKPCYCDGSGLAADDLMRILIEQGSEGVWKELENWYRDKLGEIDL